MAQRRKDAKGKKEKDRRRKREVGVAGRSIFCLTGDDVGKKSLLSGGEFCKRILFLLFVAFLRELGTSAVKNRILQSLRLEAGGENLSRVISFLFNMRR